jgi:hypothetical protein
MHRVIQQVVVQQVAVVLLLFILIMTILKNEQFGIGDIMVLAVKKEKFY